MPRQGDARRLTIGVALIVLGVTSLIGLPQRAAIASFRWAIVGPFRWSVERVLSADYARYRSVRLGWTETQVRDRLGPPYGAYDRDTAPADWRVKGWGQPRRAITHRVLVYIGSEPIAYVFLDKDGRVEEVFVTGS